MIKCNSKINEIVNSGVTFLYLTHSTKVAKKFCKIGIVMKNGSIKYDGKIDEAAEFYEKMVDAEIAAKSKSKNRVK